MENTLVASKADIINTLVKVNFKEKQLLSEKTFINPVFDNLIAEGGENFFNYISWMGFAKDSNLMILSSLHHYYYDFNDLTGVKTLINLKMLNHIIHLDSFLHTLFRILPAKANFVGCFKENSNNNGTAMTFYQSAKFLNGLKNIPDSRTDRRMSKKDVSGLLEGHGYKVVDMTDINGITYFSSQNISANKLD